MAPRSALDLKHQGSALPPLVFGEGSIPPAWPRDPAASSAPAEGAATLAAPQIPLVEPAVQLRGPPPDWDAPVVPALAGLGTSGTLGASGCIGYIWATALVTLGTHLGCNGHMVCKHWVQQLGCIESSVLPLVLCCQGSHAGRSRVP